MTTPNCDPSSCRLSCSTRERVLGDVNSGIVRHWPSVECERVCVPEDDPSDPDEVDVYLYARRLGPLVYSGYIQTALRFTTGLSICNTVSLCSCAHFLVQLSAWGHVLTELADYSAPPNVPSFLDGGRRWPRDFSKTAGAIWSARTKTGCDVNDARWILTEKRRCRRCEYTACPTDHSSSLLLLRSSSLNVGMLLVLRRRRNKASEQG
ncbi:hypothetical protein VTL71DRAFT_2674 [Oculimacula yallundae]|uniref:Uncharacterized protein n=1 Tax=Oculimacula yallundae TaxID=86028 RepID=A0ABR4C9I5_9HELO